MNVVRVKQADWIRHHLRGLVMSARARGESTITIRVGDVHRDLGLGSKNYHNACQVLRGTMFREEARVERVRVVKSPPQGIGANLEIEFRIL